MSDGDKHGELLHSDGIHRNINDRISSRMSKRGNRLGVKSREKGNMAEW